MVQNVSVSLSYKFGLMFFHSQVVIVPNFLASISFLTKTLFSTSCDSLRKLRVKAFTAVAVYLLLTRLKCTRNETLVKVSSRHRCHGNGYISTTKLVSLTSLLPVTFYFREFSDNDDLQRFI